MVAAQRAKTSVDTGAETSIHTSPRQHNSPLKRGEGDSRIRKRSRASAAIDIESDSDSKMHKREKLAMTTRWRAPKVRCPLQIIFCQTKKDFNNHYGLDTEGKDPRLLKDLDVLEGDWLSIFSHSRDTSSYRVKCSSIRPEQYEDLLIFYMKVYQKRPMNMEVNVSFARAYVLQFSPRAVKAGRLVQFAWAIVGEEHNNGLKKFGHFHMHYLWWKVINGAGDLIVGTVNVKEPNIELTPPPPIAPLASHSLSVQLTDDRTKEGKLRALIEDVQCRLTAEVEILADVVKEKEMQHNLLQEMWHRVEVGRRAYICPPPPSVMSPTLDNFTLPAKCAGCGYGHNVNKALMLVVLPCKHTYHSVCFATLCAFTDQCMAQYCSMAIPRDAQSTVIWGDANMSCGSSGRSKVFSRVKKEDEPSLERLQVVRNEGIGGEDHGLTADTVNLKPTATSVDVPVTATKVMIGTEWLESKVQDLSAANAEEEKVEEEKAEGDNVEEEAEQQELAYANKDIAEVLEDLSSQGFSSAELDLGDDSPLGHFHKVLASRKGRVHLGSRSSPAKKWKPSAGGCMLVMWVPCHLYIAVDCLADAEMHVVWMSKIYCLFAATPHPQQFLVRFNQLNLPIAIEDEVLVLILHPPPLVRKKKRKRQKPAVPIEEIVIDRVPPPLQIDLPDLNQCPPPLANDPRVLILDLNSVLLSHFWPSEEIPKHTKRMTEVSNVSSLVCKAFPKIRKKFAGRIMSQSRCTRHKWDAKVPKTNKPIFYKELSRFWHGKDKYNASNTLIVDDSAYKCFCNLRHCCIILPKLGAVPEHEFDGFLTEKLVNWLWHWLLAPDHPQYAKENMMHTPLDNESLSVFHFAAAEC
ncbi:hypothetical protein L7F22_051146 [Adiantum nelumboides]|nr:hypothetical protein [Adiantum nelumboides]